MLLEVEGRAPPAEKIDGAGRVYYCMTMARSGASGVLTIRIGADLERSLNREARRRRTSKSEMVREILTAGLGGKEGLPDLGEEARRQSLRVSDRCSERQALEFLEHAADTRGWE